MKVHTKKAFCLAILFCLPLTVTSVYGQDSSEQDVQRRFEQLSPEEQAAAMEQWQGLSSEQQAEAKEFVRTRRDKYKAMSPEEQEAAKASRVERKNKWEAMSPEEREAAKARRQEMKNKRGGQTQ